MKKYIFISIFVFVSVATIKAQCTPDTTIQTAGIYPKNLPDAREDSLYDEVVQFKMPKDTQSIFGLIKFDSISITNITNIPSGLVYQCSPVPGFSLCTWPGGGNGCLRVFGKVDSGVFGKKNCVATLRAYVVLGGKTTYFETKDTLLFTVQPEGYNLGISKLYSNKEEIRAVIYPIPFDQILNIELNSKQSTKAQIELYTISGQRILFKNVQLNSGQNAINIETSALSKGIYVMKMTTDVGEYYNKLIK